VKRGEANNGGMALAGIILGSVSIVVGGVFLVLLVIGVTDGGSSGEEYGYDDPFATSLVVGAGR
ncbi:hypothetical protein H5I60_29010, partial [Streptomyces griseolus]|nr:hypothetical protein [Streptomyces griseolus]